MERNHGGRITGFTTPERQAKLRSTLVLDNPKLLTLAAAAARRARAGRLVLTNGVFDLLHTGHLNFLQQARSRGDTLWVALNGDASVRELKGPYRPIQNEEQRAYALAALSCVDGIIPFSAKRLPNEIRAVRPALYCKAGDYSLEKLDSEERTALNEVGAEIVFLPFLAGFSTTALIERIRQAGGL